MDTFPNYYDPDRINTLFYPDMARIAQEALQADLRPGAESEKTVHLLIIDMQVDFCHEKGSLYVPGAPDDIRRLIEFIFQNAEHITDITCTLDSHLPFQIFHPPWWIGEDGAHPEPMTIITYDDVQQRKWRPVVRPDYSVEYVKKLEQGSKKQLMIWPYHVLIGGMGNALDTELWSAVMWHSLARKTQPTWLVKGRVPETEHYSAIQPEIPAPDHPQGGKNRAFLEEIKAADYVLVAGEAESHCVLETLEDIVATFKDQRQVLQKIYVLQDCMSPVQHPEVDFHAIAIDRFESFEAQGVNFINSTAPLPFRDRLAQKAPAEMKEPTPVSGLERMGEWEMENMLD